MNLRVFIGYFETTPALSFFTGCGSTHLEASGTISFNSSGGNLTECQWRIIATHGEKVNMNITSLTIEDTPDACSSNFLEIRDGHYKNSPLIGEPDGAKFPFHII